MNAVDQEKLLQLHDIHLPDPAGWWPPAPGWWLATVFALLFLYWISRRLVSWYKSRRWRKRILAEFSHFHGQVEAMNDSQFTTEISRHLRQLALTLYPDVDVASLAGTGWLNFLEQHSKQKGFLDHPARALVEAPYRNPENNLSTQQKKQLLKLARQWAIHNIEQEAR